MNSITFFHCADLHLDTPFRALASKPGLPAVRRKSIMDNLSRLIDKARGEKPDFIFIPGDLFEHEYTGLRTVSSVNNLFASVPETRIMLIAGNHDPEAANSHYRTYAWSGNVTFIGSDSDSVYFEDLNTEVFGLGWISGTGQAAKLETMEPDSDRINVLLFHGDVDLQIGTNDYNSISSNLLNAKGFDYVAAGHNHKRKTGEGGGIFYNPGSLEPLGFDEPGKHGYFSGTIKNDSLPIVTFIENSNTFYETIELDISGLDTNQKIADRIVPLLAPEGSLYKVVLVGTKNIDFNPDTEIISEALSEAALFTKVRDESSVTIPVEEVSLMKGLKGEFARLMLERIENAGDDEKTTLEKALYYGIEAIDNGKIERAGGEDL
jgi:DNA repair exonuclease SbcCD nuclease subunit